MLMVGREQSGTRPDVNTDRREDPSSDSSSDDNPPRTSRLSNKGQHSNLFRDRTQVFRPFVSDVLFLGYKVSTSYVYLTYVQWQCGRTSCGV